MSDHRPPDGSRPGRRIGSVCSGYGGLDLAVELVLGGQLAWYADVDRHASAVLRQHWPHAPNLGDLRTIDWTRVEPVDVLTAGFPCQDYPEFLVIPNFVFSWVLPRVGINAIRDNGAGAGGRVRRRAST